MKIAAFLCFTILVSQAMADVLPDGPGKAATVRVCGRCHSPERAATLHQRRSAWEDEITKMIKLGATGSDEEFEAILGYLSKNFGPEAPAPLNINKADMIDLETTLAMRRSQARALIAYRTDHGDFHSLDDLRKVPGIDLQKLEAKKATIIF